MKQFQREMCSFISAYQFNTRLEIKITRPQTFNPVRIKTNQLSFPAVLEWPCVSPARVPGE